MMKISILEEASTEYSHEIHLMHARWRMFVWLECAIRISQI